MHSLRVFLNERLAAAAEEILGAVEKTIIDYKEEICRAKDLEISRLRMQLKILKSESRLEKSLAAQEQSLHQSSPPPPPPPGQRHHQSFSAAGAAEHSRPCEDEEEEEEEAEENACAEPEHPRTSPVKTEQPSQGDFWMEPDDHLDGLDTDMKDFMPPPTGLRAGLQDPSLPLSFHPGFVGDISNGDESKDRPYCCSVCEKRFSNSSHLAAHIRTHTGERPYRCEICRKTFITTSALNRHQTIHSEGKRFICNYCGKTFKWMESLGRHIRSVHKRDNHPE